MLSIDQSVENSIQLYLHYSSAKAVSLEEYLKIREQSLREYAILKEDYRLYESAGRETDVSMRHDRDETFSPTASANESVQSDAQEHIPASPENEYVAEISHVALSHIAQVEERHEPLTKAKSVKRSIEKSKAKSETAPIPATLDSDDSDGGSGEMSESEMLRMMRDLEC